MRAAIDNVQRQAKPPRTWDITAARACCFDCCLRSTLFFSASSLPLQLRAALNLCRQHSPSKLTPARACLSLCMRPLLLLPTIVLLLLLLPTIVNRARMQPVGREGERGRGLWM